MIKNMHSLHEDSQILTMHCKLAFIIRTKRTKRERERVRHHSMCPNNIISCGSKEPDSFLIIAFNGIHSEQSILLC